MTSRSNGDCGCDQAAGAASALRCGRYLYPAANGERANQFHVRFG
jgi:hypothetical protein